VTSDAQDQTEAEYIAPANYYETRDRVKDLESKLRMQERHLKEIVEDISLKNRSLEYAVAERNDEKNSNTDLRVRAQNLVIDLNATTRKMEEAVRKLTVMQNKHSALLKENSHLSETVGKGEARIAKLLQEIGKLKEVIGRKDKEKFVVEEQMVKVIRNHRVVTKRSKPIEIVTKHRPKSSLKRKEAKKLGLTRSLSLTDERGVKEAEVFTDLYWTNKAAQQAVKAKKNRPRKRRLRVSPAESEEESPHDQASKPSSRKKRAKPSKEQGVLTPVSSSQFADSSTPSRRESTVTFKQDQVKSPSKRITSPQEQVQRRTTKLDAARPPMDSRRESTIGSQTRSPDISDIGDIGDIGNIGDIASRRPNVLANLHRPSTTQSNPGVQKREDRSSILQASDESQWAPRIRPVAENVIEENEPYISRSIESITTNSSQEQLVERVVMNTQGHLITMLDKKLDTTQLQLILVEESSRGMQFDCDDPDMTYSDDGTAQTHDGQSRFYLPFNPNTVFGLRGDVFYHSLFQVFQPSSKVADHTATYVTPYKLQGGEEVVIPPRTSPIRRSPKKPPHSSACGVNCKHLNRSVKPKTRGDMVLPLKKQDIGL
jgi:hypothetical protein